MTTSDQALPPASLAALHVVTDAWKRGEADQAVGAGQPEVGDSRRCVCREFVGPDVGTGAFGRRSPSKSLVTVPGMAALSMAFVADASR